MLGGVTGAPVAGRAAGGRAAGGRLVTLWPGRDDTTRDDEVTEGAVGVAAGGGGGVAAAGARGVDDGGGVDVDVGVEAGGAIGGAVGVAVAVGVLSGDAVSVVALSDFSPPVFAVLALVVFFAPVAVASAFSVSVFFARLGFSGAGSRFRPRSSAWRRTRSAWASTIVDDADVTPTPMRLQRSTTSFDAMPSSLASAETRMLLLKRSGSPHLLSGRQCSRLSDQLPHSRSLHRGADRTVAQRASR
jgi:hypothetical protein